MVAQWWTRWPGANIGIRPPAGVIVIDVDPRHGGERRLARLVAERGSLPATWTARTGSGGWHCWYTVGELLVIRGRLAEGVDIKHGGSGYVVAPPSRTHAPYRWLRAPVNAPAAAPLWLRQAVQPELLPSTPSGASAPGNGQYSLQCLTARIGATREGRRHFTVYGAFKDAAAQGDLDAFEPDLLAAGEAVGLPAAEVLGIARDVGRSG